MKTKTMRATSWHDLETFLLSSRNLATSTTDKTLRKLRALERAGVNLARPRRAAYDAFLADRKRRGRDGPGCRHYGRAMRHLLAWRGIHWPDFRLPRATSSPRELLPDHVVHELLEYQGTRGRDADNLAIATARACFQFAFYFALRTPSELHDLDVDDVDQDARTLRVWSDKTERHDIVHLQEWEVELVHAYVAGPRRRAARGAPRSSSLVLHPWTGRPFSREGLRMFLWRHGRAIYPRFHGYALRHAGLTNCYLQTRDIFYTMERARHRRLSSTQVYVHAAEALERRRRALPLMRPFTLATS